MHLQATSSFIERADASDLSINVTLLCVSGEEKYGINYAKIVCESYFKELNPAVVLGEGGIGTKNVLTRSPDKIVFAVSLIEKGALWLTLRLNYKSSGHGAVPTPNYANKMMINALGSLTNIHPKIQFNANTKAMFRTFGQMEKDERLFARSN